MEVVAIAVDGGFEEILPARIGFGGHTQLEPPAESLRAAEIDAAASQVGNRGSGQLEPDLPA